MNPPPTPKVSEPPASGQEARLERWLRSPMRRRLLIALAVVLMVTLSTILHVDAAQQDGREIDWLHVFRRKGIDWVLWGLAAEPILLLARFLARNVRWLLPLILLHAGLAYGVARGLGEAETYVANAWLPAPVWMRPSFAPPRAMGPGADQAPGQGAFQPRAGRQGPDGLERRRAEGQPRGAERAQDRGGPPLDRFPSPEEIRRRRMRRFTGPRIELGVLLYLVILGMGWGARSYLIERDVERHAANLELRAARLEAELSSAKIASLEGQLQPHFLFNALHSVGGLIRSKQSSEALTTLSALGGLLRATLDHGNEPEVEFERELALAEQYLEIESIRLGERLQVETHIAPGLSSARVPALVLLPLVENAVKYAVAPRPEGGRVELRAAREGNQLHLTVSDDGPGFPEHVLRGETPQEGKRSPIGIENTRARLATLYGDAASLELHSPPGGGATVHVRLPFEEMPT
jgi:signal transduction histidine kinase